MESAGVAEVEGGAVGVYGIPGCVGVPARDNALHDGFSSLCYSPDRNCDSGSSATWVYLSLPVTDRTKPARLVRFCLRV